MKEVIVNLRKKAIADRIEFKEVYEYKVKILLEAYRDARVGFRTPDKQELIIGILNTLISLENGGEINNE